jgi:hypothetical protein
MCACVPPIFIITTEDIAQDEIQYNEYSRESSGAADAVVRSEAISDGQHVATDQE